jgi:hypothetical protein
MADGPHGKCDLVVRNSWFAVVSFFTVMKILLIHPGDDPENGPWATVSWNRIIDLGLGGMNGYERWARRFDCTITPLDSLRDGFEDFRRVREVLGFGCNRVVDDYGLDWWEILSIHLHGEMETLILLKRFASTAVSSDEIYVSRPGLHASLLQYLLPGQVKVFPLRREARRAGLAHYLRVFRKLSTQQSIDVFWDKFDSGYQFRGRLKQKRAPSMRPAILVPTAYINVSRTGLAYAKTFPDEHFLMIATRRSGWVKHPPKNVATAWLSSYAAVQDRDQGFGGIEKRWSSLLTELCEVPEFKILDRAGYLQSFPNQLLRGLEVRDAWRNVLDTEPVQAVLCADDSNPYTRIPMLLAQARGLRGIACHHGALDGRYFFKRVYGDVVWAKDRMEEDYLVRCCGVPQQRVEIGPPTEPVTSQALQRSGNETFQPYLLFISESYDVWGGREEEFYRDILPPLADLALATGRELIVKLHPAESEHERVKLVQQILSAEQYKSTRVVSGPLSDDLLANAWFGITILSTVSVQCAKLGIPCFLCKWLEAWPYGYVGQYTRFGVGIGLNSPGEIAKIPQLLKARDATQNLGENWSPGMAPGRLRQLYTTPLTAEGEIARSAR